MIKQVVDRCHVGDTNRQVIRFLISRLRNGYQTWIGMEREKRRLVMQECVRIHHENREVYRSVMNGRF